MRSRPKTKNTLQQGKNQPLNINISFNINPKNILHHELPPGIKQAHSEQLPNSARTRQAKHRKAENELAELATTDLTMKKGSFDDASGPQISKKALQRIKKRFLNKINNMNITLALPENQPKQKEQDVANDSSLMSAKMQQYDNNLVKKSSESLQFNFNSISGKSKILTNNQTSKILPVQSFKKGKNEAKQADKRSLIMTQSKETKVPSHSKGYSTFTDLKGSPETYRRKKARGCKADPKKFKVKQENLQQKLDRFKLDMMKLALAYDQTEVLKTKLSSEYYNNIRSRQISKDLVEVQKINEVQEHEKTEQIKNYQAIKSQKEATPQQQSQSFKQLKDVYQDMARKKQLAEMKQCTQDIVQYYTQLTSQPKCVQGQLVDKQSQASYSHSSLWSHKMKADRSHLQRQQKQQPQLQQFMVFLQQKLSQSDNKSEIARHLRQFLEQYTTASKKQSQIQQKPQQREIESYNQGQKADSEVNIGNIDHQINRQLQYIPTLKEELMHITHMSGDQVFELEQWEQNYKNQLLKIKGKMWKEYKNIRSVIENRIQGSSHPNEKLIQTKKTKQQNRIMKCLSEKLLKHQTESEAEENLQQLKIQQPIVKLPKQKVFLMKQQHLFVERSLSDENCDSRSQLEILDIQPAFIPTSSSILNIEKEGNFLMSSLVKIEMEQKQAGSEKAEQTISSMHNLNEQDKEDIFEFIFLDICIELYQQAIENEKEGSQSSVQHPANRILSAIREQIEREKKRKTDRQSRKIGFSTNLNTIKQTVQQICQFIASDIRINHSPLSNKDRVIKKLATPLGPSQFQILKSLRMSLFSHQPVDDYGDEVEQADLLVVEPDLFLYYENEVVKVQQLSFPKYYDDDKRDQMRISFLRNCTHIHQKAIFDCLNQNLDYHRSYGIWGQPFAWKKTSIFRHQLQEKHLNNALTKSAAEVVRCAAFVCGLLIQKEDSLIKDISSDSSYVRRLQDERIYKLLQNFVEEMEEKWFFHDDEEAEILVELSHIVWTLLIKEAIKEFQLLLK